jgi:hypothetical protein
MPQKSPFARTGLVCVFCRQPVARVEHTSTIGLHIHCPACDQRWIAQNARPSDRVTDEGEIEDGSSDE